jgi:hypothetical protein
MKQKLGTLHRISPREVWPGEAHDFTPWLAQNLPQLTDAIGIELELLQTEASVGDFSVDILAKDLATARTVVIENQFGPTNHDHLGKLLTYASGTSAIALVWVAEEIREEHRQALEWLNERTDEETSIFALELQVLQIDDSPPAFHLEPVVAPNKWQKATRTASRAAASPRGEAYLEYFTKLLDELREKHRFTRAKVAFAQNWYSFSSGIQGVQYGTSFAQGGRVRAEVYIDREDQQTNKQVFDSLYLRRKELETRFGEPLSWERLDDRRASRVAVYRPGSIDVDDATLSDIQAWAVSHLLKFREVFGPPLRKELAQDSAA